MKRHNKGFALLAVFWMSLLLGILALVWLPVVGFLAAVTGVVTLVRIKRQPHRHAGRLIVIMGLVFGTFGALGTCSFLLSSFLPAYSRARELSNRLVCASNMKAVGTAMNVYLTSYEGDRGAMLDWLVEKGHLTRDQIVCPSSGLAISNYVFVPPSPDRPVANRTVVMYEPLSNHNGEGGNMLFADGHAEFVRAVRYDEMLNMVSTAAP